MNNSKEKTTYMLLLYSETVRALKVAKNDDVVHMWLPKSQVNIVARGKGKIWVSIPLWLAEENGLDPSLDGEDYEKENDNVIE